MFDTKTVLLINNHQGQILKLNIIFNQSMGSNQKLDLSLLQFLQEHRNEAGIVYRLSRKKVEDTADFLVQSGFDALPYHAGLDAATRARNQDRFIREEGVIVVATIAFGMGIDKPNVRFVAHLDLPKSMEGYYQETGRAGRDGLPADAWMAFGMGDVVTLKQMVENSEAGEERKRLERQKLEALLGLCESATCRRQTLLGHLVHSLQRRTAGVDAPVARHAVKLLEGADRAVGLRPRQAVLRQRRQRAAIARRDLVEQLLDLQHVVLAVEAAHADRFLDRPGRYPAFEAIDDTRVLGMRSNLHGHLLRNAGRKWFAHIVGSHPIGGSWNEPGTAPERDENPS